MVVLSRRSLPWRSSGQSCAPSHQRHLPVAPGPHFFTACACTRLATHTCSHGCARMQCTRLAVTQCPTEARWLGWRGAAGAAAVQPDGYARARARSAPSLPHPDDYEVQHLNSKDTPLFKRRKCVACVYTKAIFKSWKHLSIPLKQSDEFHAAMRRELSSRNTGAVFPVFPDICQLYDH